MPVSFRMLGPLEVDLDGEPLRLPSGQITQLLVVLLVHAGQPVAADTLVDVLWSDDPPPTARKLIQVRMSQLRKVFAGAQVELVGSVHGYRLEIPPGSLDLHEFRALVRQAATSGPATAETLFRDALRLWRGPALGEIGTTARGAALVTVLQEEHLAAVEAHADAALACGRHHDVVEDLTKVLAEHPLRERMRAQLMLCLHREGRRNDALAVFDQGRRTLTEELGLEPGRELQSAQAVVLAHETHPHTTTSAPAQLPGDLRGFTGRGGELGELERAFAAAGQQPSAVVISAVSGTAGVGKTALAVHWAHAARGRFPDGQLYVNLRGYGPDRSAVDPAEALHGFLEALNVPPARIPTGTQAKAALFRSVLSDKRALVVLDNARDAEQVRPLLPAAPGCFAVVTSRNQLTSLIAATAARPINLDVLPRGDAVDLLTGRLGAERIAACPDAVNRIIDRCASLPLALAIVAARAAAQPEFPLDALADELDAGADVLDAFDGPDATTNLRSTFSWSYRGLSTGAAALFRLLGLHSGPDISTAAVASLAGVAVDDARRLLLELSQAHLLTEHVPGRFTFHDLLRAYATELARAEVGDDDRVEAVHRLLDHYLHNANRAAELLDPNRRPIALAACRSGVVRVSLAPRGDAMGWFEAEHAVVVGAVTSAFNAGFDSHAWQLAWLLATFLRRKGRGRDWITTQRIGLEAAVRSDDLVGQANAHYQLALAHYRHGDREEVGDHLRRALDGYRTLGDHYGQASTYYVFCWQCEAAGNYGDALSHATKILELYRRADHPGGQARALGTIGWYHAKLGNHHTALDHCLSALEGLRHTNDLSGQANTWDSIGYIRHELGDYDEAIDCYRNAIALYRDLDDRYNVAEPLIRLGDTHHARNDVASAKAAWRQALHVLTELHHPHADEVRAKLAGVPDD